jgi:iron complex transport system substrate-binding protein
MNIVSLLPSGTEIVAALGATDALVGVSHECDYPSSVTRLPRVTSTSIDHSADAATIHATVRTKAVSGHSLYTVDWDLVRALAPDLIVTQALCDVCAVSETECRVVASELVPPPRLATLSASTLDGVLADIQYVADAMGHAAAGDALVAASRERLAAVHRTLQAAGPPRPRVVVVEWTDPLFIAGHWVPEMIHRAGGRDVMGTAGARSTVVARDAIVAAEPDVVLVAPCGYDVRRAVRAARDSSWPPPASVWAIDANALLSRPGPRLIDGVETLAAIFHPALFGPPRSDRALPIA